MNPARIFIVEDENIVALDIQLRLQDLGYEVVGHAASGEEALKRIATTQPDLVLMDVRLRGPLDGIATAHQVRQRFNLPVIYLTAYADAVTLARARETEAYGYLIKPFEDRELISTIELARYKHHAEVRLQESEARYRLLARYFPNGVVLMFDHELRYTLADGPALAWIGLEQALLEGRRMDEVFPPEVSAQMEGPYRRALAGETVEFELEFRGRTLEVRVMPVHSVSEGVIAGVAMGRDISQQKAVEAEVQAHMAQEARQRQRAEALARANAVLASTIQLEVLLERLLDAALQAIPAAQRGLILLRDPASGQMAVRASRGFKTTDFSDRPFVTPAHPIFGAPQTQILTDMSQLAQFIDLEAFPECGETQAALMAPLLHRGELVGMVELHQVERAGAFDADDVALLDALAQGAAVAIENAFLFERVQNLASLDYLTNLYNRRIFFELAEGILERAKRTGAAVALCLLDLDHFKQVNDTYGHQAGDQLLEIVAQRCSAITRTGDILARYGGEEIVLLLPDTEMAAAHQTAERLRAAVGTAPFEIDGHTIRITASVGVAVSQGGEPELEALLRAADVALYAAKRAGRDQVGF